MRTITETKTINLYKFGENETVDQNIKDYFSNDYWFFDFQLQERIDTLKEFSKQVYGELDYSISCVPDRGEFIRIINCDLKEVKTLVKQKDNYPLTGCCYDYDLLDSIETNNYNMNDALYDYLKSIHDEYESLFTDENMQEFCDINEYEFTENGEIY